MSHSKKLKVLATVAFVLSLLLPGSVVATEASAKTDQPIKNCETVRMESVAPKKNVGDAKSPDGSMRADHPMRIRVPVEPCEPPRKQTSKTVK